MILLCLGPVRGTLELQPYDEDTEAYEVPTIPGPKTELHGRMPCTPRHR